MMSPDQSNAPSARLILMTPPIREPGAVTDLLTLAFAMGGIASVIARFLPASEAELSARARALLPRVQEQNAAFLLQDQARLAAAIGADGAHLSSVGTFRDSLPLLKPALIAGAGGLATKHDAMLAGEQGADYVMFGEPDAAGKRPSREAIGERVAWWAEIFEIPCVAYAETIDDVSALAGAGADFVALADACWCDPGLVKTALAEAFARISAPERVG
jgi:thiamine-phosphate pyrophosphorylase